MKRFFYLPLLLALSLLWASPAGAQFMDSPQASPKAIVGQTVGITEVGITYHRPAVKGREIWGKIVPMNTVWRAGANENTVIQFSTDVTIEGQPLAAGKYGLHMIPSEKEWTVILSKNTSSWGSFTYNEAEDALRVQVKPVKSKRFYEYLTYEFDELSRESAVCALKWENQAVPITIGVDVHQVVLASYREQLRSQAGFTWQGWNQAANYCLQNDVNHQEALAWASRSVFMSPNPQNMITKAQLAGKVKGEADNATAVAMKTLAKDLEANPCTWKEYNGAATFAMNQKQYGQALEWIDKAVDMSPNMTTMMAKAQILEAKGNGKAAEKVKKEAIALGSNAELNNYGYQLLFGGKPQEAIAVFEANTEKHPEDPNVWDSLGEGYVTIGEKEKAIKALKKSLSLNPPPNVRTNSMKLLKQLGVEYEAAKP